MNFMRMQVSRSAEPVTLLCTLMLLAAAGCSSGPPPLTRGKPVPWTVKLVKTTPDLVEVDIFGVNKLEDDHWRNRVRMDDYCKPNSDLRQGVLPHAKSYRFDGPGTNVLESTDPIWKIGMYMAMMTNPTVVPRKIMRMGSSIDVRVATAPSTSSS